MIRVGKEVVAAKFRNQHHQIKLASVHTKVGGLVVVKMFGVKLIRKKINLIRCA
jgi:hypothetical protein